MHNRFSHYLIVRYVYQHPPFLGKSNSACINQSSNLHTIFLIVDITFDTVWHQYIDEKLEYGEIQSSSYSRYCNDYKRFFMDRDHNLKEKRFARITADDLEKFIRVAIAEMELSRKAYTGLRTIIRGTFKYGKKHHYTDLSITQFFGDLEIPRGAFTRKVIDKEVFMENEVEVISSYLRDHPTL